VGFGEGAFTGRLDPLKPFVNGGKSTPGGLNPAIPAMVALTRRATL
jgi:hypothetical protein